MSRIEDAVCDKIQARAAFGLKKYGVTLEREDLTLEEWIIHAQEELMDACSYLEVVLTKVRELGIGREVLQNKPISEVESCQAESPTEALR